MKRRPTESITKEIKPNGLFGKTIKKNSYVVTLCEKGGSDVKAVRMEYFQNKMDAHVKAEELYPKWNVKGISKLYEEDFDED